jgi:hypothetical protein
MGCRNSQLATQEVAMRQKLVLLALVLALSSADWPETRRATLSGGIMQVLTPDYGLASLRRTALLARKLVRCSVHSAAVRPQLRYVGNYRD